MIAVTVDELGVRRGVTKLVSDERLVSCTCCNTVCCPYPADQYGILFDADDLPDELVFNLYVDGSLVDSYTAAKNATGNGIYWWDFGSDSRALRHEDGAWTLFAQDFPGDLPPSQQVGSGNCLIDALDAAPGPVFEDLFSDTYTATDGITSVELVRQSACTWTGTGKVLTYTTTGSFSGWTLNGVQKSGNQNSPTGSYGSTTVS